MKFKIKLDKLQKGQAQLGFFLNRDIYITQNSNTGKYLKETERYLYICLFKITIGFTW